jgi:hypothetical protein
MRFGVKNNINSPGSINCVAKYGVIGVHLGRLATARRQIRTKAHALVKNSHTQAVRPDRLDRGGWAGSKPQGRHGLGQVQPLKRLPPKSLAW